MKKEVLEGKVAIITGAASGFGRGMAEVFAKEGAKIVVADVDVEKGNEVVRTIRDNGGEAIFVEVDVSKEVDVQKMVKGALEKYGKIDILCNNAGICERAPVTEMTEDLWDRMMDINLKSMFLCSKYVVPEMIKRGKGAIVNVASAGGIFPSATESAYGASKAAVIALTKTLALECASYGMRVNCICPGPGATPMFLRLSESIARGIIEVTPLKKLARPEDIAYAALFLASELSSHITGTSLIVDGGLTLFPLKLE